MLATVTSLGLQGLYCYRVTVEADLVEDGHGFEIVGLPGAAVKESRERVRASLRNGDLSYPDGRITVNLAPADTAKDSPIYDLPVLLALLRAGNLLPEQPQEYAFIGELSMSGELRPAKGVLPMARACAGWAFRGCMCRRSTRRRRRWRAMWRWWASPTCRSCWSCSTGIGPPCPFRGSGRRLSPTWRACRTFRRCAGRSRQSVRWKLRRPEGTT